MSNMNIRLKDSSRVTFGTKLTDRIWKDNNGQLICRNVVIARTGKYQYLESEIQDGGREDKVVDVYRTEKEVFDPIAIASFENKPFCDDHPEEDVDCNNYKDLACGFMRDVRRGIGEESNCLICDIVVTDPDVIELIESGDKRELSLGYNCNIEKDDQGRYVQTHIRGNHLALVDNGRAGIATIRDSAVNKKQIKKTGGFNTMFGRKTALSNSKKRIFRDEDMDEEIVVEELEDETDVYDDDDVVVEEVPQDNSDIGTRLSSIESVLGQILSLLQPQEEVVADDDEVLESEEEEETEEEAAEEVVEEAAEELIEEIAEDEEEEEDEEYEYDEEDEYVEDEEEEELLDADEILEEKVQDKKPMIKNKAKDSSKVYSKFVRTTDRKANKDESEAINKAFANRYNNMAKGGI